MNSPQVASLLANQEGLETQAEADMKRKQFDSLMTQRGLEFGLPPAAMRMAAETANQQGRGAFFMRWLRGEREVPATSGGPPPAPGGGAEREVERERERAAATPVPDDDVEEVPRDDDDRGDGRFAMLRRLVGFGDEGVPMIYHGLPSPIPDRELSHLLGANRDRVHQSFSDMAQSSRDAQLSSDLYHTLQERERVATEIMRSAWAREFVDALHSHGDWAYYRGIMPGIFDAMFRRDIPLPGDRDTRRWVLRAADAENPHDVMLALNRSGLSPEQMIQMFREMKAALARHQMRDGVAGSVIRGVGALAHAGAHAGAAGLNLGVRAGSAGLNLGVRAGSAAARRASPIITGAARAAAAATSAAAAAAATTASAALSSSLARGGRQRRDATPEPRETAQERMRRLVFQHALAD
jgi:hypothetical protein